MLCRFAYLLVRRFLDVWVPKTQVASLTCTLSRVVARQPPWSDCRWAELHSIPQFALRGGDHGIHMDDGPTHTRYPGSIERCARGEVPESLSLPDHMAGGIDGPGACRSEDRPVARLRSVRWAETAQLRSDASERSPRVRSFSTWSCKVLVSDVTDSSGTDRVQGLCRRCSASAWLGGVPHRSVRRVP